MKSTKALKMACLSVGLATAWSPLGGQAAHADTQVDVNMNFGTTPGLPQTYDSVVVAVVFNDNSYEISNSLGDFSGSPSYDATFDVTGDFDHVTGFVTAGYDESNRVMVSIGSLNMHPSLAWDSFFSIDEDVASIDLHAFLKNTLDASLSDPPTDPMAEVFKNNVLTNPSPSPYELGSGQLFGFSDQSSDGLHEGNVSIQAVTVPLPRAWLMGGSLFALMALGKRSLKWIQLRQTQSLT